MDNLPQRKQLRLKDFDYSQAGYYFVTICTQNRKNYLGEIYCRGGALLHPVIELSAAGEIASEQWFELTNRYKNILLDQFVIMPNHIHGIIIIDSGRAEQSPAPTTIGDIICAYKSMTTKLSNKNNNSPGRTIWQKSYYDHII
ncbi:MAG: transposase, partial [Clostridiales bacterium]|nr:transposase [Clostridiales bacterium]